MKKTTPSELIFDIINYTIMFFIIILTMYPFIYILLYSISDPIKASNGFLLYPKGLNLDVYGLLFKDKSILHGFLISVARSVVGSASSIVLIAMTAYVLTKQKLIARKFFMMFIVFTMYFSNGGLIPTYVLITRLHLKGTFAVYIVPYLINVFFLILVKTYIEDIDKGLEEAAFIDGANEMQIFFRVIAPVSTPIFAAVVLFQCIFQWNMFQDTLFYNAEVSGLHTLQYKLISILLRNRTESIELAQLNSGGLTLTSMSIRMGMTVITVLPIACVYPFIQKYFVKGLLIGAIKC